MFFLEKKLVAAEDLYVDSGDTFSWKQRWAGDQLAQRHWKGLENPILMLLILALACWLEKSWRDLEPFRTGQLWPQAVSILKPFGSICKTVNVWEYGCWYLESTAADTEECHESIMYNMQRHYVHTSINQMCVLHLHRITESQNVRGWKGLCRSS